MSDDGKWWEPIRVLSTKAADTDERSPARSKCWGGRVNVRCSVVAPAQLAPGSALTAPLSSLLAVLPVLGSSQTSVIRRGPVARSDAFCRWYKLARRTGRATARRTPSDD